MKLSSLVRSSLVFSCLFCVGGVASDEGPARAVTVALTLENDVFAGTDRGYTNGAKFSFDFAEAASVEAIENLPRWAKFIGSRAPDTRDRVLGRGATISIGQSIFTPADKEATELVWDDRPYAGWSYLSMAFRQLEGRSADTWELTLGLVGPDSYAEDLQNWVHEKIGSTIAQGWDNQLKNEFGGILAWRRETELFSVPDRREGWGADVSSSFGVGLGNIQTYGAAGVDFRFGYNRSVQASPPRIRPGNTSVFPARVEDPRVSSGVSRAGFFLTLGAEGRYVEKNVFVEGNTWADSHGLAAQPWVGDYYGGLTFIAGRWTMSYVYTVRSEEFEGQTEPHEFGGLTIGRSF